MRIDSASVDPAITAMDTANRLSVATAKKLLDSQRAEGEAMVKMIQSAAQAADKISNSASGLDVMA